MSEIAACTLIQEEPDRKTERYLTMFKDYPDVVSVDILQEMLGICRKNAYLLVKQNKIHSARVGRSYKIPKLCVVEYLLDQMQLSANNKIVAIILCIVILLLLRCSA